MQLYSLVFVKDEFCTYMQLEYAEKEDAMLRAKRVEFVLPAFSSPTPHNRAPVLRIISVAADSSYLCAGQVRSLVLACMLSYIFAGTKLSLKNVLIHAALLFGVEKERNFMLFVFVMRRPMVNAMLVSRPIQKEDH